MVKILQPMGVWFEVLDALLNNVERNTLIGINTVVQPNHAFGLVQNGRIESHTIHSLLHAELPYNWYESKKLVVNRVLLGLDPLRRRLLLLLLLLFFLSVQLLLHQLGGLKLSHHELTLEPAHGPPEGFGALPALDHVLVAYRHFDFPPAGRCGFPLPRVDPFHDIALESRPARCCHHGLASSSLSLQPVRHQVRVEDVNDALHRSLAELVRLNPLEVRGDHGLAAAGVDELMTA
mmetsp:Transcript_25/g.61  ORF Transcript_25/g.61 Transcript_25/m.61 type:complete len:235 (-) Transcript_25:324-1028(-)